MEDGNANGSLKSPLFIDTHEEEHPRHVIVPGPDSPDEKTLAKEMSRKASIARVAIGTYDSFQSRRARLRTPWNSFFRPVDVDDVDMMEERREASIVWSINPFVHNPYHKHKHPHGSGSSSPGTPGTSGIHDPDTHHGPAMITVQQMKVGADRRASVQAHGGTTTLEQLGTPKASYAELFYDLFFVASLTSFGIKHEITQAQAIASYVAFFSVLWCLRLMLYDVRFETGDVIHRVFKFLQLLLLAAFAAFAGRFDVYYGFADDHGLEDQSNPSYSERTTGFFSFRGMTLIYIISRAILALQYLLLWFYARRKAYPASNQFLFQIAALVVSGCMWIGSYFLEGDNANAAMRIAKFGLWYCGIGIELLSTILIWLSCRVTGFRRTHLAERFSTLTLLILGEGVIGYAIALQAVIGGVGFGPPAGLAVVMVCLTIYFLWVFYFTTFQEDAEYNVPRAYSWAYLHYPFHVAIILVLQACNSLMLYANVWNAIDAFGGGDANTVGNIFTTFYPPPSANATSQNVTIGNTSIQWNPQTVYDATFLDNLSTQQLFVIVFDVIGKIFQSYNLHLPEDYQHLYDELSHGQVATDESTVTQLVILLASRFLVSAVYYLVACGSTLLFSAGILLIQRWPKDRYGWIGIYIRVLFGCGFIGLIGIWGDDMEPGAEYLNSGWMMPTFVIVLAIIIDFISNAQALRQYRKAGKLA